LWTVSYWVSKNFAGLHTKINISGSLAGNCSKNVKFCPCTCRTQ